MPSSISVDNGEELFNIFIDTQGRLNFNANSTIVGVVTPGYQLMMMTPIFV